MLLQGNQGALGKQSGQGLTVGLGEFSDVLITQLMHRYYELTYRGSKFVCTTAGGGVQLAATHLFSTAIATFTPILALYNPLSSSVNLVLCHAKAFVSACPLATGAQTGAFLFVCGSGQTITNSQTATPVNCKTLKASGSQAFGITNVVLAGAVGNPILLDPLIGGPILLDTATANASLVAPVPSEEVLDGSIIIPPGGYVAIANGISNAVAGMLVSAGFKWDEIPV